MSQLDVWFLGQDYEVLALSERVDRKESSESFTIDTARLWNHADPSIKAAQTLSAAKSSIKKYSKNLEI